MKRQKGKKRLLFAACAAGIVAAWVCQPSFAAVMAAYGWEAGKLESSGSISDITDKSAVEGALVRLRSGFGNMYGDYVSDGLGNPLTACTDSQGVFSFMDLPVGEYTLEIVKEGYVVQYADLAVDGSRAQTCSVMLTPETIHTGGLCEITDGFSYEEWVSYMNTLKAPERYNCVSNTAVSYSGGVSGQTEAIKEHGQGFFGGYIDDFDGDGLLELLAAGSWYQGSAADATNMEAWIYDCIPGTGEIVPTRAFAWAYAGGADVIPCVDVSMTVSVCRTRGENPYLLFSAEGLRSGAAASYRTFDAVSYNGIEQGAVSVQSVSSAYQEQSGEPLFAGVTEQFPKEKTSAVCRLSMRNQYGDAGLSSGSISFSDMGSDLPDVGGYLNEPLLLASKLGMNTTDMYSSCDRNRESGEYVLSLGYQVEETDSIQLTQVLYREGQWEQTWINREDGLVRLFDVQIGDSLETAYQKLEKYAATAPDEDYVPLVTMEEDAEFEIYFTLGENGLISGWTFSNYFDGEMTYDFTRLHRQREARAAEEDTAASEPAEETAASVPEETLPVPLTAAEVQQILFDMGYCSEISNILVYDTGTGRYTVDTYEYTFLNYTAEVDAVSADAVISVQWGDPIGTVNLRSRSAVSGNPLPVAPTSAAPVAQEPLSREYAEAKINEQKPNLLSWYSYASEDEEKFTYRANDDSMWFLEIYKYSGEVRTCNYRGVIIDQFFIEMP